MIIRDLVASLLRRWYLVLAGFLATAALGLLVYQQVPATYQASASVVLVPPPTAVISGDNPYLYMGGLDQALSVLVVKLNSAAIAEPIGEANGDVTYVVGQDVTTSGPIMQVDVDGAETGATLSALRAVLDVIPGTLASLQEELAVEPGARISVLELAVDREVTIADGDQIQALLTAVAAGGASTLLLSGLLDRVLLKRRARRQGRRDESPSPPGRRAVKSGVPVGSASGTTARATREAPADSEDAAPPPAPFTVSSGGRGR